MSTSRLRRTRVERSGDGWYGLSWVVVTYQVHALGDPKWYRTMHAESLESMRAVKEMNLVDEVRE